MSKKAALANILSSVGAFRISNWLVIGDQLVILAYHRVLDIPSGFAFDRNLVSANCRDFEWQVNYIKQYYSPITFAELFDHLHTGKNLPRRPVIITFDDGFDDNYLNAYRILKSSGVPATFFICSDYMDKTQPFWFDWVVYLTNKLHPGQYDLDNGSFVLHVGMQTQDNDFSQTNSLLKYLKTISNNRRLAIISNLECVSSVSIPTNGFNESRPMNWSQVKEMAENEMEICSHTKSHPILSQLDDSELLEEISGSKMVIESNIKRTVDVFSYPVGGESAFNDKVIKLVKICGYKAACSYLSGVNNFKNMEHFLLRRMHVEYYTDRNMFKAMLGWPSLFS